MFERMTSMIVSSVRWCWQFWAVLWHRCSTSLSQALGRSLRSASCCDNRARAINATSAWPRQSLELPSNSLLDALVSTESLRTDLVQSGLLLVCRKLCELIPGGWFGNVDSGPHEVGPLPLPCIAYHAFGFHKAPWRELGCWDSLVEGNYRGSAVWVGGIRGGCSLGRQSLPKMALGCGHRRFPLSNQLHKPEHILL